MANETETVTLRTLQGDIDFVVPKGADEATIRNLVATKHPELIGDIKTGQGMGDVAAAQAKETGQRTGRESMPLGQGEQEAGYRRAFGNEEAKGNTVLTDADVATMGLGGIGLGRSVATRGLKATAIPFARSVLGAGAGAYGGGKIGGYLGGDTGESIGKVVGGLAGGVMGGAGMRLPSRGNLLTSLFESEKPAIDMAEAKPGTFEPTTTTSSKSPTAAPPLPPIPKGEPTPFPTVQPKAITSRLGGGTEGGIRESGAGVRNLILTPQEAQTEDFMQGLATKRASERGMQFAGGMTPREGRTVPAGPTRTTTEEYPGPKSVTKFGSQSDTPPSTPSTPVPEPEPQQDVFGSTSAPKSSPTPPQTEVPEGAVFGGPMESEMEAARRGAPGVNPTLRSLRRQFEKGEPEF